MRKILVIDTSILCCLLSIPGKERAGEEWDKDRVEQTMKAEENTGSHFVLPIASLIETGNHIAQTSGNRFDLAKSLTSILTKAIDGATPWVLFTEQAPLWEKENLARLAEEWPNLAAMKLTIGDATIKKVADFYAKAGYKVEILTGDEGLKAHQPAQPEMIPRRRHSSL